MENVALIVAVVVTTAPTGLKDKKGLREFRPADTKDGNSLQGDKD